VINYVLPFVKEVVEAVGQFGEDSNCLDLIPCLLDALFHAYFLDYYYLEQIDFHSELVVVVVVGKLVAVD
jgi:hypothetical protein